MVAKKFIIALTLTVIVYFISDFFFSDFALYLLGGVIWGTIENMSFGFGITIGFVFLAGSIVLSFKLRNKPLRYMTLIVVSFLLYILDFFLMKLVSYDPNVKERIILDSAFARNMYLAFRILYKSLIVALLFFFQEKRKQ